MARTKGTPKTGGRQKGTPNKTTQVAKEWLTELIDKNKAQIKRDLKALEPKERLQILEKFMAYVVPKATQIVDIEVNEPVDFSTLSDDEVDMIARTYKRARERQKHANIQ